jgi:BlaI family transcriptional regulator, penicillinase repressor
MAKNKVVKRPAAAEIAILTVLWDRGELAVPEIWEALKDERGTGYTTILKQLQVMETKGLVSAEKKRRPYVYRAEVPEDGTKRRLLDDFANSVFGGSLSNLAMKALSHGRPSRKELEEIRKLLDKLEKQK